VSKRHKLYHQSCHHPTKNSLSLIGHTDTKNKTVSQNREIARLLDCMAPNRRLATKVTMKKKLIDLKWKVISSNHQTI